MLDDIMLSEELRKKTKKLNMFSFYTVWPQKRSIISAESYPLAIQVIFAQGTTEHLNRAVNSLYSQTKNDTRYNILIYIYIYIFFY